MACSSPLDRANQGHGDEGLSGQELRLRRLQAARRQEGSGWNFLDLAGVVWLARCVL